MIYTAVTGRLGNQMFHYAFSRAVQEKCNPKHEITMNFSLVYETGKMKDFTGFENSLRYFNIKQIIEVGDPIKHVLKVGSLKQKKIFIIYKLMVKYIMPHIPNSLRNIYITSGKYMDYLKRNAREGIYYLQDPREVTNSKELIVKSNKKNIFIIGSFENPIFFDSIRDKLLEEFTPVEAPMKENEFLYKKIAQTESVCISIRRGDYVNDSETKKLFDICTKEYFDKAIKEIKKHLKNPVFFFFSDDIDWVKQNISIDDPSYYESGRDAVWEKLRLMYSCKHFIISNSTFSWWAQYLSRNPYKIVISPDRWFKTNSAWPLLQDDFIKIGTNN